MKLLLLKRGNEIEHVIKDGTVESAIRHIKNGYPELIPYKDELSFEVVDGEIENYPVTGTLFADIRTGKHRENLQSELDQLEISTAKGFMWLVKLLISNGTIKQSDIPAKLIEYKSRIEEIETELTGV